MSSLPLAIAWYPFFPIQMLKGQQTNDVQLAWFAAPDKKKGLFSHKRKCTLTDEIGYVSFKIVGSICIPHARIMSMSILWL